MSFIKRGERLFDFIIRELIKDYSERLYKKVTGLKGNHKNVGAESFVKGEVLLPKESIISQRCFIKGSIKFGKRVYVSPGAILTGNLTIGDGVFIEAGAVLKKNVPNKTYVYGNPAKFRKINTKIFPKLFISYSEEHSSKSVEIKDFFKYMVELGKGVIVGEQVYVEGGAEIKIGNNVKIGDRVLFATSHHVYDSKKHHMLSEERWDNVIIGNNVVIGDASIIRGKVKIGDNAIILPGSVIVSDIQANSIVHGCPAKPRLRRASGESTFFPYIANFFAVIGHMFAPIDYFNNFKGVHIEYGALVNKELLIIGKGGLNVETLAMIAPRVIFVTESLFKKGKIFVSNGAWIGAGAIILPGVKIGKGALIGAGAVVYAEVPDWEIWVGNPARKIGVRGLHENS